MQNGETTKPRGVAVRLDGNDVIVTFSAGDSEAAAELAQCCVEMILGGALTVMFSDIAQNAPSTESRQ